MYKLLIHLKKLFFITLSILLCFSDFVQAESTTLPGSSVTASEMKDLHIYLNKIHNVKSKFSQIEPDGTIKTGILYLKRPGYLKWEYIQPKHFFIIANHDTIIHYDYELEEATYTNNKSSLLNLLTDQDIDINKNLNILSIDKHDSYLEVLIADIEDVSKKFAIRFNINSMKIEKIFSLDEENLVTEISLSDTEYGIELDKEIFLFKDPKFFKSMKN